jgi:transposase InsO family protein
MRSEIIIEQWRKHYNTIGPHSSLYYRPLALETSSPELLHLDRSTATQ